MYGVNRYSRIMTQGERVIAVSNTVRDYILREYPNTLPWRIQVIHRGVDGRAYPHGWKPDPVWQQAFFAQFPHAAGKQLVTPPGRITRLKGTGFIELIARLKRRGCRCRIVGGAHLPNSATALALPCAQHGWKPTSASPASATT
jgi:hypothetical protein